MLRENNIGSILKEAREKNNLTQQELANRAFLTRQAISKYELNVSQISVENFMLLLDILGTSVLLENGKIKTVEVKNMNTIGYLKIDAQTAKFIVEKMDEVVLEFKKSGVELIDIFELKGVMTPNNNSFGCLDKAFYITVDFKNSKVDRKYIENPFCDDKIVKGYIDDNPLHKLLKKIESKFGEENINLLAYYSSSLYEEVGCAKIQFEDVDLIRVKLKNYYDNFNPDSYDKIFSTPRAGYQRVKKDGLYGFIDSYTGEEKIPCKFDFVEYFDYNFKDHRGNLIARARLNGEYVIIDRNGNVL